MLLETLGSFESLHIVVSCVMLLFIDCFLCILLMQLLSHFIRCLWDNFLWYLMLFAFSFVFTFQNWTL